MLVEMSDERLFLEHYLSEQDVPCPGCGYNLRGLKGAECPECGQALRLNVGLVEPRLASFIAGLIGFSAGLGFHGFLLALFLFWGESWQSSEGLSLMAGFGFSALGVLCWLKFRRGIRSLAPKWRPGLVGIAWASTILTVVWFYWVTS